MDGMHMLTPPADTWLARALARVQTETTDPDKTVTGARFNSFI
jgi:hypothetical protein